MARSRYIWVYDQPMKTLTTCAECGQELSLRVRADAIFCSTKCRVQSHRKPFPQELTDRRRWIRHTRSKIPLTIWDEFAKVNDSATWNFYEFAKQSNAGVGMGFVFNGDGIIGIDLDNAFANGKLKDWAQAIVDVFADTYMELSPSGNGIHIIAKAEVFSGRRFTVADGGIEIYATGRYFTMTGKRFNRSPKKLKRFADPLSSVMNIIDSVNLSGAINS
jgi:primase-polymerase (primpol)-like protein